MKEKIKSIYSSMVGFIKKNKYISIALAVFIIILLIVLIYAMKNSTYAVNSTDYVSINCPEVASPKEVISCDISINITTFEASAFQIDTEYEQLEFNSFEIDSECSKDKGCFESVNGGKLSILGYNMGTTIKGLYKIGTIKYNIPDTAKNGDIYTINFKNITITDGNIENKYTGGDITKKVRIPSDVNTLNSITLDKGTLNEQFDKDTNNYTSTIDSDTLNITLEKTNEYSTIEGKLEDIKLNYGTNNISIKVISETKKENTYTIKVFRPYTFTSDKYKYYKEDNKLYTNSDIDKQIILSNLNIPKELTPDVNNNILTISYGDEKLVEINLINITSNKYSMSNNKVYIGKNVDYDTFKESLVLNGVTAKVVNANDEEITTGTITKDNKLKVYYNNELLEEYTFSEEYLNINTTTDDTDKIIMRQKKDTTVEELLTKIETSGAIKVKDKDNKELSKTDIIKTGDIVEISLEEKTETYTISVLGDINGDGKIDNGDVALLYNNLKGKNEFKKYQTYAGDIIEDSKIKINDVARLYRFFKGRLGDETLEVGK